MVYGVIRVNAENVFQGYILSFLISRICKQVRVG